LATPAPTPIAPAASPPTIASPATIFIGFIVDISFLGMDGRASVDIGWYTYDVGSPS
jgi:hypothetical protein